MKSGNRETKRRLIRRYVFNRTSHWFLIGITIPVLTVFQLQKGYDLFEVAILSSVYSIAVVLLELPTGGLSDTMGRKRVYLSSVIIHFLAAILFVIAGNLVMMIAGAFLTGTARALSSGSIDAWFVDEFYRVAPRDELQAALSWEHIFVPAGLGVAALAGGWLPSSLGVVIESSWGITRYAAVFLVQAALFVPHFAFTAVLISDSTSPRRHALAEGLQRVPHVIQRSLRIGFGTPAILLMLLASLAWGVGFSGLEGYWQPRYRAVAGDSFASIHLGLLTAAYFAAGAIGSGATTMITKLFGGRQATTLAVMRALQGLLFLLLAMQSGPIAFAIFYVLVFFTNGIQNPLELAIFHDVVPESERSTLLSFSSLFMQGGAAITLLIVGWVARASGIPAAWFISASVLGLSALFYALIPRHTTEL